MLNNRLLNAAADAGIKPGYRPWEINLVRKLNLCTLLGILNVLIALVLFPAAGYYNSIPECLAVLLVAPLVFLFNIRFGYLPALYLFLSIGCFLFFFLAARLGLASLSFLYYFPLMIGLAHMLARKELYHHLGLVLLLFVLAFVATLAIGHQTYFRVHLPAGLEQTLRYMNIGFSFFTCIGFIVVISNESITQERQLKMALHQKEVLLAELYHRSKNNLAIVSSLLNLKKNRSFTPETQSTLEECRNLVFSMSLVHNRIYNNNKFEVINLRSYMEELLPELVNSLGGPETVACTLTAADIELSFSQAVPCSLIVNELITNAFKHARLPERQLSIHLQLHQEHGYVHLEFNDNGPGREHHAGDNLSMGMDLIASLAGQLNARYSFFNNNGLHFRLQFKP